MTATMQTEKLIELVDKYGAHNYHPLPMVISKAEGVWVYDPEGNKYMDMLSGYSSIVAGHSHPDLVKALTEQAQRVTLTARAFHNDQLGPWLKELCEFTGQDMALPMNTGAEAIETAIKAARKWGYKIKGVPDGKAEIITCSNNFHGRTVTIVSFSTEELYKKHFGPFTPGFKVVNFGDVKELESAFNSNTVAFLVEPIQAEAGIIIPPAGYLKKAKELCEKHNALFIADEIQTGFGRTGKKFACEHDGIKPDMVVMGKALGGGILPISAIAGKKEVLSVFEPGDHGSTFGGNPLACAVSRASIALILREKLVEKSAELGAYFVGKLKTIKSPHIKEVRGHGLLIGVELHPNAGGARRFCEALMKKSVLCKETHDHVIRFAPPLIITKAELDFAFEKAQQVLTSL